MQFLADMCKSMHNLGYLTIDDLYTLSDEEILKMFLNCADNYLSESFKKFQNATEVYKSEVFIEVKYCVNVKSKSRYIVPLVSIDGGYVRINEISKRASAKINAYLNLPKGATLRILILILLIIYYVLYFLIHHTF